MSNRLIQSNYYYYCYSCYDSYYHRWVYLDRLYCYYYCCYCHRWVYLDGQLSLIKLCWRNYVPCAGRFSVVSTIGMLVREYHCFFTRFVDSVGSCCPDPVCTCSTWLIWRINVLALLHAAVSRTVRRIPSYDCVAAHGNAELFACLLSRPNCTQFP